MANRTARIHTNVARLKLAGAKIFQALSIFSTFLVLGAFTVDKDYIEYFKRILEYLCCRSTTF